MKKIILLLVVLLVLYIFATLAINWDRVATWSFEFPLFFATYRMPVSLYLILVIMLLLMFLGLYVFLVNFSIAQERKKYMQELLEQRAIAEKVEKSRIADLAQQYQANHDLLMQTITKQYAEIIEKQSQLDKSVAVSIESFEDRICGQANK